MPLSAVRVAFIAVDVEASELGWSNGHDGGLSGFAGAIHHRRDLIATPNRRAPDPIARRTVERQASADFRTRAIGLAPLSRQHSLLDTQHDLIAKLGHTAGHRLYEVAD